MKNLLIELQSELQKHKNFDDPAVSYLEKQLGLLEEYIDSRMDDEKYLMQILSQIDVDLIEKKIKVLRSVENIVYNLVLLKSSIEAKFCELGDEVELVSAVEDLLLWE